VTAEHVSPPVAEVVARFRGRVVDVQHVRWSEPPAVAPAAWLGAGALLLGLGAALALRAVSQAAACGEPPCPQTASAGLGALLIGLGVVPLALSFIRWRDRPRTRYTIGEGPEADLPVALPEGGETGALPLVIALESGIVLGLPPGVRGSLSGATSLDLAAAAAQGRRSLALPPDTSAHLELGELSFDITLVPPAQLERGRWQPDRLALLTHAGAALLLGGWFLSLKPGPVGDLEQAEVEQLERVARYLTSIPANPAPPPEIPPVRPPDPRPRATSSSRPPPPREEPPPPTGVVVDASGLVAPTSPSAFARKIKGKVSRTDSEHDYDRVAGILNDEGFGDAVDSTIVATRMGMLAYEKTAENEAWWAKATGGPPRMAKHFGGLELAETERGGGVHSDKPKPTKPVNMVTLAAAAPMPKPTAEQMKKIRRIVKLEMDPPSMDKDAGIDSHTLHQHMRKRADVLRTCYEDRLDVDATTDGVMKMVVRFDDRGAVASIRMAYTTLNIGSIEKCVLGEIRRWKVAPHSPRPSVAVFNFDFSVRNL
jgi:hypothetical protein